MTLEAMYTRKIRELITLKECYAIAPTENLKCDILEQEIKLQNLELAILFSQNDPEIRKRLETI